jgi:hypothetical protein
MFNLYKNYAYFAVDFRMQILPFIFRLKHKCIKLNVLVRMSKYAMHAWTLLMNNAVPNRETFDNAAYQVTCALQESK